MVRKGRMLAAVLLSIGYISGCSGGFRSTPISTLTIAPPQNPYQAKSSTPDIATPTVTIPTEQPILATPTPFKHIIKSGDTLYGIALQYNILLDRLVSANPGVNTSILEVGTELVIPFSDEEGLSVPTPTPYPLPVTDPWCYPNRDEGAWCILMVRNDQAIVLENISAAINIYDNTKSLVYSFEAIPPINYLYPDQSLPLGVYLDVDLPDSFQANSVLLTAFPAGDPDQLTEITNQFFQYREGNKIADINGFVKTSEVNTAGKQIWIAAVAFSDGVPVGFRKWISAGELATEQEIPFNFILYSLGPPIDQIELFSELH